MRTPIEKLKIFLAAAGWFLFAGVGARARGQDISEYKVKAAYLLNFVKFVNWPQKASDDGNDDILIGILGDDPFGGSLDDMAKGKAIGRHSILIKRFENFDEANSGALRKCRILFISYSEKDDLPMILRALKGAPVLTVSEIERFPAKGGMILFDQEGQRITLAINKTVAEKSGLTFSSQLLQVAQIYKGE
jgi:hypothetical protein